VGKVGVMDEYINEIFDPRNEHKPSDEGKSLEDWTNRDFLFRIANHG
jgi:hypothetical protein